MRVPSWLSPTIPEGPTTKLAKTPYWKDQENPEPEKLEKVRDEGYGKQGWTLEDFLKDFNQRRKKANDLEEVETTAKYADETFEEEDEKEDEEEEGAMPAAPAPAAPNASEVEQFPHLRSKFPFSDEEKKLVEKKLRLLGIDAAADEDESLEEVQEELTIGEVAALRLYAGAPPFPAAHAPPSHFTPPPLPSSPSKRPSSSS